MRPSAARPAACPWRVRVRVERRGVYDGADSIFPFSRGAVIVVDAPASAPAPAPADAGGDMSQMRVAGSLMVTRAIGDFYLKTGAHSYPIYAGGCPYLSAEPEVGWRALRRGDRFLVLACDGIWDNVSNAESVEIVARAVAGVVPHGEHRCRCGRIVSWPAIGA